jgi:tetratricopeptide (TPR) repeat protein
MMRWFDRNKILRLAGVILVAGILVWSGCGSSLQVPERPAGDENLELLNQAARRAFDRGRIEQAEAIYRRALERALVRDDANAIVDARYNLAVCLMKLDAHADVLQLIGQAETELSISDQPRLADLLLLKALLYYKTARPDDAWEVTRHIMSMTHQTAPDVRSRTHFLRGLIAAEREDMVQLRDEIAALGDPRNPILRGDLMELNGHLAMGEQNWSAAVKALDGAVVLRRETLDYAAMAKVMALAAEACNKAGKTTAAAQRFLRAGRSAGLQADYDSARRWLGHAEQLAGEAGEDQIAHEARFYLEQIQKASPAVQ